MTNPPAPFRLTYATMFDPPADLHQRFEVSLARAHRRRGAELPMSVGGQDRGAEQWAQQRSPIQRDWLLGRFPLGTAADAAAAVAAAAQAGPGWAATPYGERCRLLRRAASLIDEQVFELAAALALEVGKNRMEALGEAQETADLIRWYCDQMDEHAGFDRVLPNDPLTSHVSRNRTRLKPYGVWAVVAPFNFPQALAGGPIAAALVAGNTVVFKVASDTA